MEEEKHSMNSCTDCLSRNTCLSADKPMENYIRSLPLETAHHRVATQETKCGFGLQGVCCRLCANGPCRVTPDAPGASAEPAPTPSWPGTSCGPWPPVPAATSMW